MSHPSTPASMVVASTSTQENSVDATSGVNLTVIRTVGMGRRSVSTAAYDGCQRVREEEQPLPRVLDRLGQTNPSAQPCLAGPREGQARRRGPDLEACRDGHELRRYGEPLGALDREQMLAASR